MIARSAPAAVRASILLGCAALTIAAATTSGGIDLAGIDHSVRPGDDFDAYANGSWRASAEIPADRTSAGSFLEMFRKSESRTTEIVLEASGAHAPAGSDQHRIADAYAALMDQDAIERRGLAPLAGDLAAIETIQDRRQLSAQLGSTLRADVDPINATSLHTENLFGLFVTQSLHDPSTTIPYLLQGGLGLADRDYYLSDKPAMAGIRTAYRAYVERFLTLAGRTDAAAGADRIMALETKIAAAQATIVETQDIHKADIIWQQTDFPSNAPGIDWASFFSTAGLASQPQFDVWQPTAIAKLSTLVASEPLDEWKDWLIFHRLNTLTIALPQAFDRAHFDFYEKTLTGTEQQAPRQRRAVAEVGREMGDAVGRLYVQRYFPASSKASIQTMVRNILAAFDRRVAALPWMAPATKVEARHKIETMQVGIGYPDSWRDYSDLEIQADDPVGNLQRASLWAYHHQLAKIGRPVDRGEWWMVPQRVNSVNLPLQNALNFPAAVLVAPMYDPSADAAVNYGAAGAWIGHEISHAFDDSGADFDASGRLTNWWTPADLQHFKAAGAALAAQYDRYEAAPGLHLNGQQELSENIADLAGLAAAYDAYHASLHGKPPPVIGGLTGDQRFFLGFAQVWRAKSRDKALRAQVATDVHAPAAFRIRTVRNLDPWYSAFGVAPGQALYLSPGQRVRIW
jgi:putative endopeptidase